MTTRPATQRAVRWLAAVALAASGVVWATSPQAFAAAWLAAFTAWLGWPLGCLALLLVHALTGGRWGEGLRPHLLAGAASMVLLPLAAVPFLVLAPRLYPWAQHHAAAALDNRFYLNLPFFFVRCVLYLVAWLGLAVLVLRAADRPTRLRRLAPPGLILLAITVTFAAIDTTMSLDPSFNSSVYGMMIAVSDTLFALALALAAALRATPPPARVLDDLGRLLLGLVILWAYLDFVQLLIVWQSNLPHDAPWYARRLSGAWGAVALGVAALHFLLPFALLLAPALRRRPACAAAACLALAAAQILRAWWLVLPDLPHPAALPNLLAMVGLLSLAGATATAAWPRRVLAGRFSAGSG